MIPACAEIVRTGDPDRFATSLAAPEGAREKLWVLYALNLEIARAPFASAEPMLAEMRLQWWVDRLNEIAAGVAPPLHDVLTPFAGLWDGDAAALMADNAEMRRRDAQREEFLQPSDVIGYIDRTAGHVMVLAASALGSGNEGAIRAQGVAAGLGNWLGVLPRLQGLGLGLAHPDGAAVSALASAGLELRRQAKGGRLPRALAPALAAPRGIFRLKQAVREPDAFLSDPPEMSEFAWRFALARLAAIGSW